MAKKNNSNIINKRLKEKKEFHDKIVKKQLKNLETISKRERYDINNYLEEHLGYKYKKYVSPNNKLDPTIQSKFNKEYHNIDFELYKVNSRSSYKKRISEDNFDKKLYNLLHYKNREI